MKSPSFVQFLHKRGFAGFSKMMPYVGLFDFVASHEKLRQSEHTIHEKKAKEFLGTLAHNACHLSSSLFAQRTMKIGIISKSAQNTFIGRYT